MFCANLYCSAGSSGDINVPVRRDFGMVIEPFPLSAACHPASMAARVGSLEERDFSALSGDPLMNF